MFFSPTSVFHSDGSQLKYKLYKWKIIFDFRVSVNIVLVQGKHTSKNN